MTDRKHAHDGDDVQVGPQPTSASLPTEPVANSVSNAPAVPLAGVPETPLSNAGVDAAGPAVPSTDHVSEDDAAPQDGADPTATDQ